MYLFLNDVAASEVMLILLFILIFFGSKSIPGIARTLGKTIREIQHASDEIKSEIKKTTGDYKKDLNLQPLFRETEEEITRPLDQAMNDLDRSIHYNPPRPNNMTPPEVPTQEESDNTTNDIIAETTKSTSNDENQPLEKQNNPVD